MPLPVDSTHLSDASALYLAEYGGSVESQFARSSIIRQFVDIKSVRGTNTLQNNRVGRTSLGSVTPGVRPDATPTKFGTVSVTVDTIIIARDNVAALDAFQSNFDHRSEIGMDHGKEIGKFFDEAHIIKVIHGAQATPTDSLDGAFGSGKAVYLGTGAATGDTLEAGIRNILVSMEEEDIDADEFVVLVRPLEYSILLDSSKLIDGDFSAGHDFANGMIKQVYGAPIVKTARIPRSIEASHLLGSSYNVAATDATALAVVMHRRSLLAGETIPLTSDVYYDKKELQHFIDSHLAFGVAVNREDLCGAVFNVATP
jgi:hypothetical protein